MKKFSVQCKERADISQAKAIIISSVLTTLAFIIFMLLDRWFVSIPVMLFTFAFFIGSAGTWFVASFFTNRSEK